MIAMHSPSRRGFTLVELSIVLVILGLLVGGVLTGQSLIRAAELRSISTQFTTFATAVNTFRDKYFALPGDMPNATAYWGKDFVQCPAQTGTAATPGTCNGDGDGRIGSANTEFFRAWQQLALAGLIEGNYTGVAGANAVDYNFGVNSPKARIGNAGWSLSYINCSDGTSCGTTVYNYDYTNAMSVGTDNDSYADDGFIKAEEAYNIDMKMDDGLPAQGKIHGGGPVTSCSTATVVTDRAATYRLSSTLSTACSLFFRNAY